MAIYWVGQTRGPPYRTIQACWAFGPWDNLSDIYKDAYAYAIVVGHVTEVVETDNYSTRYAFKVDLSLKSNVKNYMVAPSTIIIAQSGGTIDGVRYVMDGDIPIKPGEHLILFLRGPFAHTHYIAHAWWFGDLGPWGRFVVREGKVYSLSALGLVDPEYSVKGVDGVPLEDFIGQIRSMGEG